ncbi:MAG: hypothetical protein ACI8Y4_001654 [Candidatus Poriferisodalaceae bacterium]|jgi:hypothetical protein
MMDPFDEMDHARRFRRAITAAATLSLTVLLAVAFGPGLLSDSDSGPEVVEGRVAAVVIERDVGASALSAIPGDAVETFEIFGGKNPFQRPLSLPTDGQAPTATVPGTSDGGDDSETGGGETGTGTETGSGETSTSAPATTAPAAPTQSETEPTRGAIVAMLDIYDDAGGTKAQVRVNSTAYLVSADDVFAGSFKVVSLDLASGCGQFLFGDSPFELCKGQEILK